MKVEFEHSIPVRTENGEIEEGCPVIKGLPHSLTVVTDENRKDWQGLPSSIIPGGDKERRKVFKIGGQVYDPVKGRSVKRRPGDDAFQVSRCQTRGVYDKIVKHYGIKHGPAHFKLLELRDGVWITPEEFRDLRRVADHEFVVQDENATYKAKIGALDKLVDYYRDVGDEETKERYSRELYAAQLGVMENPMEFELHDSDLPILPEIDWINVPEEFSPATNSMPLVISEDKDIRLESLAKRVEEFVLALIVGFQMWANNLCAMDLERSCATAILKFYLKKGFATLFSTTECLDSAAREVMSRRGPALFQCWSYVRTPEKQLDFGGMQKIQAFAASLTIK